MEQNLSVRAKKVWNLMRVMFFMLKKGIISKTKLFADLNMLMKRGKFAGKSLHNLFFHHHRNWAAATSPYHPRHLPFPTPQSGQEYEFSCEDTPTYSLSIFSSHKKNQNKHRLRDIKQTNKRTDDDHRVYKERDIGKSSYITDNDIFINATVMKALDDMLTSGVASPGFVNSPVVKQLRITDSPFPLSNGDEDGEVDEAADKFIMRFYNDLRRQN